MKLILVIILATVVDMMMKMITIFQIIMMMTDETDEGVGIFIQDLSDN